MSKTDENNENPPQFSHNLRSRTVKMEIKKIKIKMHKRTHLMKIIGKFLFENITMREG